VLLRLHSIGHGLCNVSFLPIPLPVSEEAIETKPDIIAAGCPFCNTMMTDGVKGKEKEDSIAVMDIAEMIASAADL
jgi:Fe-S oxidoreductase